MLGEVEDVLAFLACVLAAVMFMTDGAAAAMQYLDSRTVTEPMFVVAIMVITGTRPVSQTAMDGVRLLSQLFPCRRHGILLYVSGHGSIAGFATILTAFTDDAALTYLGSLVEGLSDGFKYALVTGAVTATGLTIIANAPNPGGIAILRDHFEDETIHPVGLFRAAWPPTVVAVIAFWYL